MEQQAYSYEDYLRLIKTLPSEQLERMGQEIIRRFQSEQLPASRFAPVIYLLDYAKQQYIYVDEACFDLFGFTAKQFKEEGLEGYLSKWHPQDYQIVNKHVFPQFMQFLQSVPLDHYPDLIFTYNYRFLNAKGEYITVLQRSSFIPSTLLGKPLGNLGVVFEITHFKNDASIIQTIEQTKQHNDRLFNELLFKKVYALQDENVSLISKRELEVLRWMAEGFSSKQIAQSLGLSSNTVNNHRKNMLHKTGCHSSIELLSYAIKHGFL